MSTPVICRLGMEGLMLLILLSLRCPDTGVSPPLIQWDSTIEAEVRSSVGGGGVGGWASIQGLFRKPSLGDLPSRG